MFLSKLLSLLIFWQSDSGHVCLVEPDVSLLMTFAGACFALVAAWLFFQIDERWTLRWPVGRRGNAEMLKAEKLKSEGQRTEDGGQGAGDAEVLKAEKLKSEGQRTGDGGRRTEVGGRR